MNCPTVQKESDDLRIIPFGSQYQRHDFSGAPGLDVGATFQEEVYDIMAAYSPVEHLARNSSDSML